MVTSGDEVQIPAPIHLQCASTRYTKILFRTIPKYLTTDISTKLIPALTHHDYLLIDPAKTSNFPAGLRIDKFCFPHKEPRSRVLPSPARTAIIFPIAVDSGQCS